ncbi:DNA-3-methyladenine glycosylase family protein [Microbacterium aurantiacum]|uniref:DNA-3-methyladenine glycosylase family protein n=1 Tax=Microbacterium aurantiacum TaxID=162393 RepID=UPI004036D616
MTIVERTREQVRARPASPPHTQAPPHPRAPARPEAPLQTEYRPRHPLDLRRTVMFQRRGANDPTMTMAGAVIWRASRTPEGVATLALTDAGSGVVRAAAWGQGREWAIAHVPDLCGARDDATGFAAERHPLVAELFRRMPGLRLGRTDGVFDALACAIFEQKVTGMQAFAAWRRIVSAFGETAPGPTPRPMAAPPDIDGWRDIPSWAWHRAGLEPPQSKTVVRAARRGRSIVRAVEAAGDGEAVDRVLVSQPGIGPWTSAETRIRALGDPDAVSVGDFHLAHEVGYALAGARTDDDGMLALLEPWSGQRQRVIRLLAAGGVREPRKAPRLHPEDHRDR